MGPTAWVVLTFRHPHSTESADRAFHSFHNATEKAVRSPVGYFRVLEETWSGVGTYHKTADSPAQGCRLHIHALLYGTDNPLLNTDGNPRYTRLGSFWHYGQTWIQPYAPTRHGAQYVLKAAVSGANWDTRRLEHFTIQ